MPPRVIRLQMFEAPERTGRLYYAAVGAALCARGRTTWWWYPSVPRPLKRTGLPADNPTRSS